MKEIKSAPGYSIDKYGRVIGLFEGVMRPATRPDGYKQLVLRVSGKYTTRLVHRLVAEAYLGQNDLPVNHKDGNKGNNHPDNLEYVTSSENQYHCSRVLRKRIKPVELVKDGVGYWWPSYAECAEDTGIPRLSVSLINRGVYKSSNGYFGGV